MAKKKVYAVAVGRQGVAIYDSCTDTSAGTINIDQLSYLKLFFFFFPLLTYVLQCGERRKLTGGDIRDVSKGLNVKRW